MVRSLPAFCGGARTSACGAITIITMVCLCLSHCAEAAGSTTPGILGADWVIPNADVGSAAVLQAIDKDTFLLHLTNRSLAIADGASGKLLHIVRVACNASTDGPQEGTTVVSSSNHVGVVTCQNTIRAFSLRDGSAMWTAVPPPKAIFAELAGASVVLTDDGAYLGAAVAIDEPEVQQGIALYKIDLPTKELVPLSFELHAGVVSKIAILSTNSIAVTTPSLVRAYSHSNGKLSQMWSYNLGNAGENMVLVEANLDIIALVGLATVVRVDRTTGAKVWNATLTDTGDLKADQISVVGDVVLVKSTYSLEAYSYQSGAALWSFNPDGGFLSGGSLLTFAGPGVALLQSSPNSDYSAAIFVVCITSGAIAYTIRGTDYIDSWNAALLAGGNGDSSSRLLFQINNGFQVVDGLTGGVIASGMQLAVLQDATLGSFMSGPGIIPICGSSGFCAGVNTDFGTIVPLGPSSQEDEYVRPTPVLSDGVLYIEPDPYHYSAHDAVTGKQLWTVDMQDSTPEMTKSVLFAGYVFVATASTFVDAFNATTGVRVSSIAAPDYCFGSEALNTETTSMYESSGYLVYGVGSCVVRVDRSLDYIHVKTTNCGYTPTGGNFYTTNGVAICTTPTAIEVYEIESGKFLWAQQYALFNNIINVVVEGAFVYVSDSQTVTSYIAKTGGVVWNQRILKIGTSFMGLYATGYLLIVIPSVQQPTMYCFTSDPRATNVTVWETPLHKLFLTGALVSDGSIVVLTGSSANQNDIISNYGIKTGELRWSESVMPSLSAKLTVTDRVVAVGDTGATALIPLANRDLPTALLLYNLVEENSWYVINRFDTFLALTGPTKDLLMYTLPKTLKDAAKVAPVPTNPAADVTLPPGYVPPTPAPTPAVPYPAALEHSGTPFETAIAAVPSDNEEFRTGLASSMNPGAPSNDVVFSQTVGGAAGIATCVGYNATTLKQLWTTGCNQHSAGAVGAGRFILFVNASSTGGNDLVALSASDGHVAFNVNVDKVLTVQTSLYVSADGSQVVVRSVSANSNETLKWVTIDQHAASATITHEQPMSGTTVSIIFVHNAPVRLSGESKVFFFATKTTFHVGIDEQCSLAGEMVTSTRFGLVVPCTNYDGPGTKVLQFAQTSANDTPTMRVAATIDSADLPSAFVVSEAHGLCAFISQGTSKKLFALGYDSATGQVGSVKWSHSLSENPSGFVGVVKMSAGKVLIIGVFGSTHLTAFDEAGQVWSTALPFSESKTALTPRMHVVELAPLGTQYEDTVFVTTSNTMMADLVTGTLLWYLDSAAGVSPQHFGPNGASPLVVSPGDSTTYSIPSVLVLFQSWVPGNTLAARRVLVGRPHDHYQTTLTTQADMWAPGPTANTFVLANGRFVALLDASTGSTRWNVPATHDSIAAVGVQPGTGSIFVASSTGTLVQLDPTTGDQTWHSYFGRGAPNVRPSFVFASSGSVFLPGSFGGVAAIDAKNNGPTQTLGGYCSTFYTILVSSEHRIVLLYCSDVQSYQAFDTTSFAIVYTIYVPQAVVTSPAYQVIAGKDTLVSCTGGKCAGYKLVDGSTLWEVDIPNNGIVTDIAADGSYVYVATHATLFQLDYSLHGFGLVENVTLHSGSNASAPAQILSTNSSVLLVAAASTVVGVDISGAAMKIVWRVDRELQLQTSFKHSNGAISAVAIDVKTASNVLVDVASGAVLLHATAAPFGSVGRSGDHLGFFDDSSSAFTVAPLNVRAVQQPVADLPPYVLPTVPPKYEAPTPAPTLGPQPSNDERPQVQLPVPMARPSLSLGVVDGEAFTETFTDGKQFVYSLTFDYYTTNVIYLRVFDIFTWKRVSKGTFANSTGCNLNWAGLLSDTVGGYICTNSSATALYAFELTGDASSTTVKWSARLDLNSDGGKFTWSDDGKLTCGTQAAAGDGVNIVCLDVATGKQIYTSEGPPSLGNIMFGFAGSSIIISGNKQVIGINAQTGEKVWSVPTAYSANIAVNTAGDAVATLLFDKLAVNFTVFDPHSGAVVANHPLKYQGAQTALSTPLGGRTDRVLVSGQASVLVNVSLTMYDISSKTALTTVWDIVSPIQEALEVVLQDGAEWVPISGDDMHLLNVATGAIVDIDGCDSVEHIDFYAPVRSTADANPNHELFLTKSESEVVLINTTQRKCVWSSPRVGGSNTPVASQVPAIIAPVPMPCVLQFQPDRLVCNFIDSKGWSLTNVDEVTVSSGSLYTFSGAYNMAARIPLADLSSPSWFVSFGQVSASSIVANPVVDPQSNRVMLTSITFASYVVVDADTGANPHFLSVDWCGFADQGFFSPPRQTVEGGIVILDSPVSAACQCYVKMSTSPEEAVCVPLPSSPQATQYAYPGRIVVVGTDARVLGINTETGTVAWTLDVGYDEKSDVDLLAYGTFALTSNNDELRYVSTVDGRVAWVHRTGGNVQALALNGFAYVASCAGVQKLKLDLSTAESDRLVWEGAYPSGYVNCGRLQNPLASTVTDTLIVPQSNAEDDGVGIAAFNLTSGNFLWNVSLYCQMSLNPKTHKNLLIVFCEDTFILDLRQGGKIVAVLPINAIDDSSVEIVDDYLYLAGHYADSILEVIDLSILVGKIGPMPSTAPVPTGTLPANYPTVPPPTPAATLPAGQTHAPLGCIEAMTTQYAPLVECLQSNVSGIEANPAQAEMNCADLAGRLTRCYASWLFEYVPPRCTSVFAFTQLVLTSLRDTPGFTYASSSVGCVDGQAGSRVLAASLSVPSTPYYNASVGLQPGFVFPAPANVVPRFSLTPSPATPHPHPPPTTTPHPGPVPQPTQGPAAPPTPQPAPHASPKKKGLAGGAVAVIAIVSLCVVGGLGLAALRLTRSKARREGIRSAGRDELSSLVNFGGSSRSMTSVDGSLNYQSGGVTL